jgi:hypothetical protein
MRIYPLVSVLIFVLPSAVRPLKIWDVGKFKGLVPERYPSDVTPKRFFDSYQFTPFVVRGFHRTLDELAVTEGFEGDSLDWLSERIGDQARMTTLEGALQETRLDPVIHKLRFKYFFEKFRRMDVYSISQVPVGIRKYFQLLPFFSCGGNSYRLQAPMMWISGGLKPSKSVVHADSSHNQHCVLKGSKRFMLIPPNVPVDTEEYGWLHVENPDGTIKEGYEDAYGDYAAKINYDNVDLDAFPKWRDVPWLLAELHPGDCLYMPIEWFHYVESAPGPAVTWHQWFHTSEDWIDQPTCESPEKTGEVLFTDMCVFQNDDQQFIKRSFWENHPDRTSICQYE